MTIGGDERAATHALVALVADRPAALAALETLLLALGRHDAAGIVRGNARPADGLRRPVNAMGETIGPRRERRGDA